MWHSTSLRHNHFDTIRLAMAVLVIFSHSYPLVHAREPLYAWTGGQHSFGESAVDVFFMISGFLIAMSWERSTGPLDYLKRRTLRIVPGYLCAMVISAFVVAPLFVASNHPWMSKDIALDLLKNTAKFNRYALPGAFPNNPLPDIVNGSLWTIHYEVGCYLGLMLLGMVYILRHRLAVLILFLLLLAAHVARQNSTWLDSVLPQKILGFEWMWIQFIVPFMAGVTFYLYRAVIPFRHSWGFISLALLLLATYPWFGWHLLGLVIPVCGTYVVMWVAFQQTLPIPKVTQFGDFSYGTYLYAFPIQQMAVALLGAAALGPWLLFALATPLALICGFLSWHLVEKYFMRLKKKSTDRQPPSPTPKPEALATAAP